MRVFFQGEDGQFYEQRNPGMDQPGTVFFDVKIADLDHDGKGEVILAGSPAQQQGRRRLGVQAGQARRAGGEAGGGAP